MCIINISYLQLFTFELLCCNHAGDHQYSLFVGFGTFEVKDRAERIGRNPQTKESITIPASKVPSFKAGKTLKDAVQ